MDSRMITCGPIAVNSYFLTDGRSSVIVDPGDPQSMYNALADNTFKPDAVLLTHGHFDHFMGLQTVLDRYPVPVYIHEADRFLLSYPQLNLSTSFGFGGVRYDGEAKTFRGGDRLEIGSLVFEIIHTPGHTPGSCCLRCGDLLYTGDTLFKGSVGRTDFPLSDPQAMRASLRKLKEIREDLTVCPGHGFTSDLFTEQSYNLYMSGAYL